MKKGTPMDFDYSYVISDKAPDRIVGEILTLIDAAGLPETQAKSLKDLIRQAVWGNILKDVIYLSPERYSALRKESYEEKKKQNIPHDVVVMI